MRLFRRFPGPLLLELMERRYGQASTVFCTQYQQKDWHQRLGSGVHADAIMDRSERGAFAGDHAPRVRIRRGIT